MKSLESRGGLDRPMVTIGEACALVTVSRRTIYNWLNAGKLEYTRTAGGSVRIFSETLWRRPLHEVVKRPDELLDVVIDAISQGKLRREREATNE